MAAAIWLDCLADVPKPALEQAFGYWSATEDRRPTPAAIRRLALSRVEHPPKPEDDEWPFAPQVIPPEELERRRELAEQVAGRFPILRKHKLADPGEVC